jgi:BirA family biotin operon repressor/biotin-[acetyl-CoA-carboxylase] ligase
MLAKQQWQIPVEGNTTVKVLYYPSLQSTNSEAVRLARAGEKNWTVVYAAEQTRGKGRHNRHWWSPAGMGLWFSIILRPVIDVQNINLINLATALLIRRFLKNRLAAGVNDFKSVVGLKWPNDILVDDRKICGILLESEIVKSKIQFIIAGIGININQISVDFPMELRKSAISLKMCTNIHLEITPLLNQLIADFFDKFNEMQQNNFDNTIAEYKKYLLYKGREVKVFLADGIKTGIQQGIDQHGNLILQKDGKTFTVSAGDLWLTI